MKSCLASLMIREEQIKIMSTTLCLSHWKEIKKGKEKIIRYWAGYRKMDTFKYS